MSRVIKNMRYSNGRFAIPLKVGYAGFAYIFFRIQPQFVHMLENRANFFFTFIHINASLQCLSFLISDKCVMILSILYSILKCHEKKLHVLGIDTDPDPAK